MRDIVAEEYPEREPNVPYSEREGYVPESILTTMREMEEEQREGELAGKHWCRKKQLFRDKNATPGDRAQLVSECLEEIRPMAMCVDRSSAAATTPADAREGAFSGFGRLLLQTGSKYKSQWCPSYFSEVMPFVIPRRVSGPDFREETADPWRRQRFSDAPLISVNRFVAGFARRAEAACRADWTALPIMRSVAYKHTAEHTMALIRHFRGRRGWTAGTDAARFVEAAQGLYRHLHHGYIRRGVSRVPIAGDTTKLPFAADLTPLERDLAWAQHNLAQNLPGSQ